MPSPQSKPRTLTVEFSGICTLLWDKKRASADVHMVDLSSVGFEPHHAALSLLIDESTPRGIRGPDADAAVSVPGQNAELGLWDLSGTTTEVVGATGKLTVDDSKIDPAKKPGAKPGSVRWVADIGSLCESNQVDPVCPTAAIFHVPAGHVTSAGGAFARKLQFLNRDGTPIALERYCVPRFQVTIPFQDTIALRLDRMRVLRFTNSVRVMVSNTCVCGLRAGEPANHFEGHYDVVNAKRRPIVKRAGKQAQFPWFPEICLPGFVQF